MSSYTHLTVYTDGASRGNPGPAAAGIHIVSDTTAETVADLGFALGIATNNVAEYQAVLRAAEWLLAHKELLADDIHIRFRMDSSLVASQLSGLWKINDPKMQHLAGEVRGYLDQLPGTHNFEHIPREENQYADRLANDTLDKEREEEGVMDDPERTEELLLLTCAPELHLFAMQQLGEVLSMTVATINGEICSLTDIRIDEAEHKLYGRGYKITTYPEFR